MTTACNLPSLIAKLPPATPCVTSSMSQQECAAHRARIAFEVEVVLQGYWQAELSSEMKAAVMADWSDELEDWTVEQVRWGLRQWRKDNPRRKPNPGDVVAILKEQRGKTEMAKLAAIAPPEPQRPEPVTAERAASILAEVGFNVRRIPTVQE